MRPHLFFLLRLTALALLTTLSPAWAHGDAHRHTGPHHAAPSLPPLPRHTPPPKHTPEPVRTPQPIIDQDRTPPPSSTVSKASGAIVRFSKHLYSALNGRNETELAQEFKSEFSALEAEYAQLHPTLADALQSLYEIRLEDLKASVEHTERIIGVLDLLGAPNIV